MIPFSSLSHQEGVMPGSHDHPSLAHQFFTLPGRSLSIYFPPSPACYCEGKASCSCPIGAPREPGTPKTNVWSHWRGQQNPPPFTCFLPLSSLHIHHLLNPKDLPGGSDGKVSACNVGDAGSIPGSGRSPGEGNGNPLQHLAWKIPWMEECDRLQSMGSQRVRHD